MTDTYALVRESAALLDVSAEGRLRLTGPDCEAAFNELFSADLEVVPPYKGTAGLLLTEAGDLIAIVTVCKGDDEVFVFTEQATRDAVANHLRASLPGIDIQDLGEDHDWLAVLGPSAQEVVARAAGDDILGLPYLGFEDNVKLDLKLFRMGWCGEYEYRFLVRRDRVGEIRSALLAAGETAGIAEGDPAVLPVLMLEMRSLLRADVSEECDPIEAGLHWMIAFRKSPLRAGEALLAMKSSPARRGLMVAMEQAGAAASGSTLTIEGRRVGTLARIAYSPTLARDIGIAYVDESVGWVGVAFEVEGTVARGVSAPLFVTKTVRTV